MHHLNVLRKDCRPSYLSADILTIASLALRHLTNRFQYWSSDRANASPAPDVAGRKVFKDCSEIEITRESDPKVNITRSRARPRINIAISIARDAGGVNGLFAFAMTRYNSTAGS